MYKKVYFSAAAVVGTYYGCLTVIHLFWRILCDSLE